MTVRRIWPVLLAALILLLSACAPAERPIALVEASMDSPMGPRKIMNFNGCRYAFLENGAVYDLEGRMGKTLGVLTGDILADPKGCGGKDLASTFALGGTVRVLEGRDPGFRVAVELEGRAYICENVARLDGSDVDLGAYLAAAELGRTAASLEIRDHMGREVLKTAGPDRILEILAEGIPAKLTDEDYAAVGRAQSEGGSFLLALKLTDGTEFRFYLIPELSLALVGDGRYTVTLPQAVQEIFAALPRIIPPQY